MFAFADGKNDEAFEDYAKDKVQLEPISKESKDTLLKTLKSFNVDDARCFDPNEQRKLLHVINGVGMKEFNAKIQRLASCIDLGEKSLHTASTSDVEAFVPDKEEDLEGIQMQITTKPLSK